MNREDEVLEGELANISTARFRPCATDDLWGRYCETMEGSQRRRHRSSKTSIESLPPAIKSLLTRGQELFIRGESLQAIDVLLSAREQAPHLSEVHALLGMAYESCGRDQEALACYVAEYTHRKRSRQALDALARTVELAYRIGAYQQVISVFIL